jgi:3'(2'), 5'-bisphosphate nucleotidase
VREKRNAQGGVEPFTQADCESNALITAGLAAAFPADAILAEESSDDASRLKSDRVWLVDPLDGTKGFIAQTGDFAVQIGLAVAGRAVLGVVFMPLSDALYWATAGGGAWLELAGAPPGRLTVSDVADPARMRLAASRAHGSPEMEGIVSALGIQRCEQRDSVGVKVGLLVNRICDVYVHPSPYTKQWDTCAPEMVLREAGGAFTDVFGMPITYNRPDVGNPTGILASNGACHARLVEAIAPFVGQLRGGSGVRAVGSPA